MLFCFPPFVWLITRYLEWLVGYQFPHLTQFFAHVEELVATVRKWKEAFPLLKSVYDIEIKNLIISATSIVVVPTAKPGKSWRACYARHLASGGNARRCFRCNKKKKASSSSLPHDQRHHVLKSRDLFHVCVLFSSCFCHHGTAGSMTWYHGVQLVSGGDRVRHCVCGTHGGFLLAWCCPR